ncbi:MAG TPA: AraC family transcriptional regulator [Mycobacteriales bacterium]|jgi:AraC-like DNA-binding protein|nr:AraC family transcriptional regulator [Mycobacteriales bacterium]
MTDVDPAEDLHVDSARGGWVRRYGGTGQPQMHRGHRHNELEANIVLRGWVEYLIGDRRVRFPGQALGWLLPHQTHRLIQSSPDVQMWIVVFSPRLVTELDRADAGPPRRWLRDDADTGQVRVVGEHIGELDRLCALLSDPAEPAVRHWHGLAWLLSECWRAFRRSPGAPDGIRLHPAVQAAARWLHDHAAEVEADDLPALARRCGISRPWLSKLFYEQLGESLTDYRNRQRFYCFRDLIAQPGVGSTTAAALAAGFGSYTQCFRIVRQHTGLSPRALAQRVHESSV